MLRRLSLQVLFPFLVLSGLACERSGRTSSTPAATPALDIIDLGVASSAIHGDGTRRLVVVAEQDQGRDLDGDGDVLDGGFFRGVAFGVVHVADLERRRVVNTGLVLAVTRPRSIEILPRVIAAEGPTWAFGVDEQLSGGHDRNGDGDAEDFVLAVYDPERGDTVNLGLAVDRVVAADPILAFDVPEAGQGQDLDGDGVIGPGSVPFVHDLRTGETWNTGLRGRHVLGAIGADGSGLMTGETAVVALAADESVLGDRNADGDAFDQVFEVYDWTTRMVQPTGLALMQGFSGLSGPPIAHDGRWALTVSERDQGRDLDGDGDALDVLSLVYDPRGLPERVLGTLVVSQGVDLEALALFDAQPAPFGFPSVWLYDRPTDVLVDTGFVSVGLAQVGKRVAIDVLEEAQGQDLDGNGALESFVPVLYDVSSGRSQSLGLDGFWLQPLEDALLLRSREAESRQDWNGDGDRDDIVQFIWDEARGHLVNTRLSAADSSWLDERTVLLNLSESDRSEDLNGDGDLDDRVLHAYDLPTRRLRNLRLAGTLLIQSGGRQPLVTVDESLLGQDLNGDGDLLDRVLHLVVSES